MGQIDTTADRGPRDFPSTKWSDILSAADPSDPRCRQHLDRLVQLYWRPVFCYIRTAWRKTIEDSLDLTQSFFAHMLEKKFLARVRPEGGSFRGYVKRALRNFVIDDARAEASRRPDRPMFSLEASVAELDRLGPASPDESPERAFDRAWFEGLFENAVAELRDELTKEDKAVYFDVFRLYCLEETESTYEAVAGRLGIGETDVRNFLAACRTRFREILRRRVSHYVADDGEIEGELGQFGKSSTDGLAR
jgi:RNA polymerase sigma-70 factor (ECF subfamily)